MNRPTRTLPAIPIVTAVLIVGAAAPEGWAHENDEEIPFDEAHLFLELNDTDGDLGIHALIDGDAWKRLEIEDPNERAMLDIRVLGRLRRQGLTELFFESDEPSFDELTPAQFLHRFPEGPYEIGGTTLEGEELESIAVLSHVMPAPPENITISDIPAAENCDADPLPSVSGPVIIDWDPVTGSHDEIGTPGVPVAVDKYQLVVEREEPTLLVFNVELPADVTRFAIPEGFIDLGDAFKFEIVVKAAGSGNQTAVESCFEVE